MFRVPLTVLVIAICMQCTLSAPTVTVCPNNESVFSVHMGESMSRHCLKRTDTTITGLPNGEKTIVEEISGKTFYDNPVTHSVVSAELQKVINANKKYIRDRLNSNSLSYIEGAYLAWSSTEFQSRLTMSIPYTSSSGSHLAVDINPPSSLTKRLFKSSDIEGLGNSLPIPSVSDSGYSYIIGSLLNAMELWWVKNKGTKINFSYEQIRSELFEQNMEFNLEAVLKHLNDTGVCEKTDYESDTNGPVNCARFKLTSYKTPGMGQRKVQTLVDWVSGDHPVFVLMSLDATAVQHHSTQSSGFITNRLRGDELYHNFGGVVVGYDLSTSGSEFWRVLMPRHGHENNEVKVKMSMKGSDFGRLTRHMLYVTGVEMKEPEGGLEEGEDLRR